jgi:hypothetical protein
MSTSLLVSTLVVAMPAIARAQAYDAVEQTLRD